MNATVKEGWDRVGQVCLVLGKNVFLEQWWTPVKWPDEEDPEFYKTAALNFREPDNSTSPHKSSPKCSRCGIDHEDGLCGKCAIEMTKEIKQMEAEIRGYKENTSGS